jgi:hypothetical protein
MEQKYYRFGYTNPPGEGQPRLHHSRDGAAFNELAADLPFKGYRYGTFIHNYPKHSLPEKHFAFLKAGDLVVSATRPPRSDYLGDDLRDGEGKDRRYIIPSNDHLENAIFKDLDRFFAHVSRYCVELTPEMAGLLPQKFESMSHIKFHTKGKATIHSTMATIGGRVRELKGPKEFNAVGYFLHLGKITGYPCGLVLSFSMGGYENLLWNRIVRLRYSKWFDKPVFGFALLNLPEEPERPLTPELADGATSKVLIEEWLDVNGADNSQFLKAGSATPKVALKTKSSSRKQ